MSADEHEEICVCAHLREHHGPTVNRFTPCHECKCEDYSRSCIRHWPTGIVSDERTARIIRIGKEAGRIEGELRARYLTMLRAYKGYADDASVSKEISFLIQSLAEFLATDREPPWCEACWKLQHPCYDPECPLLHRPKATDEELNPHTVCSNCPHERRFHTDSEPRLCKNVAGPAGDRVLCGCRGFTE